MSSGHPPKLLININTPKFFQGTKSKTNFVFPQFPGLKSEATITHISKGTANFRNNLNHQSEPAQKRRKIIPGLQKQSVSSNVASYQQPVTGIKDVIDPSKGGNLQIRKQVSQRSTKFVSSLFTKNPEIPVLPKAEVITTPGMIFSKQSFQDLNLHPRLLAFVKNMGFTSVTRVQQNAIPLIQQGTDCLIKSHTGSGKTLAYILPIIDKLIMKEPTPTRTDGLFVIVVVPTRELALQSYQWFETLCRSVISIVPGYLCGGEKKKSEKARIRRGINILVATPGRLLDHMDTTTCLNLSKVECLVIDEADRMLEMGYEKSIRSIICELNNQKEVQYFKRQTVLLSATLTQAVQKLSCMSLTNPKVIDVTTTLDGLEDQLTSDLLSTPENLSHFYMIIPAKLRLVTLSAFILQKCKIEREEKMLIFMATQDMVDYHTNIFKYVLSRFGRTRLSAMERRGQRVLNMMEDNEEEESDVEEADEGEDYINFLKLHGSMSQSERTAVFTAFRKCISGILLCTDVASRGLDLPEVNWIVQYTAASNAYEYVHRVGRTARANKKGSAVVFLTPAETAYIPMLESKSIKLQELKLESVLCELSNHELFEKGCRDIPRTKERGATHLQMKFEHLIDADKDLHAMASAGYTSFIRSYAAFPREVRGIFCFKELHLGHYAKSYALREAPSVLGAAHAETGRKEQVMKVKREAKFKNMHAKLGRRLKAHTVSEFDSGFNGIEDDEPNISSDKNTAGHKFHALSKSNRWKVKIKENPFKKLQTDKRSTMSNQKNTFKKFQVEQFQNEQLRKRHFGKFQIRKQK